MFKIVLIGDGGCGKTTLRLRFMGEHLSTRYIPTIGADFSAKTLEIGSYKLKFVIWDLVGQPRF